MLVSGPDGDEDLTDPDSGHSAVGLAEGSPHSGLEPMQQISASRAENLGSQSHTIKTRFRKKLEFLYNHLWTSMFWFSSLKQVEKKHLVLLIPISSSTGQHFVDPEDVEGMDSHSRDKHNNNILFTSGIRKI